MSSFGTVGVNSSEDQATYDDLMERSDLQREFDWDEINGVRKVTEIRFKSASLNAEVGLSVLVTRTFTYDGAPDYDLKDVTDALTQTP